ncbi:unnamed protein product [Prorocentrum cordatum]|uniref:ABC1 atypical kinase-like domain-containing protein n=1 Tax=Prorocentrum cordatum TaxID=2364126 RepID=A0ABN9TFM7_9DINO|nr:unnamed protein product [Polarella glacialis]
MGTLEAKPKKLASRVTAITVEPQRNGFSKMTDWVGTLDVEFEKRTQELVNRLEGSDGKLGNAISSVVELQNVPLEETVKQESDSIEVSGAMDVCKFQSRSAGELAESNGLRGRHQPPAGHGLPWRRQGDGPPTGRVICRRASISDQYALDSSSSRVNPSLVRKQSKMTDMLAFDQDAIWEYVGARPLEVIKRAFYLGSIAFGMWSAWKQGEASAASQDGGDAKSYDSTSLTRAGPTTARGETLRSGLADMGVFFVKMGQTCAQRPDLVGDELAQELKGLQERNDPFSDEVALQIIADDLGHKGPLAPQVPVAGCDESLPPLLAELNPKHVASASLGQVYKGRLHDGRTVALKVQRPGVRDALGDDWAVAVLGCKAYKYFTSGDNDYSLIVDTVATGIQMEVDYHVEAANLEEFAVRHAFLPFVSSPSWVPEYTGPEGSARVLCMEWYPSRAPSELSRQERKELVEMAVEACVVQLLVTGFVHADPHEGNLRMGDDGRVVFLDFGLSRGFAAGIRHVLNQEWLDLARVMQEVRFAPTPMLKFVSVDGKKTSEKVPCSTEEFAEELGKTLMGESGGISRFGAMATSLKKLSSRYLMLTPPYVALLCRTFITLEGLLGDDPELADAFNIYEVALPFTISRFLSPRTRKGQKMLREALMEQEPCVRHRMSAHHAGGARLNWESFAELLDDSCVLPADEAEEAEPASFGAQEGVQRRLLLTSEGAALRRFVYDVDVYEVLHSFLVSQEARRLRDGVVDFLAARWAAWAQATGEQGAFASSGARLLDSLFLVRRPAAQRRRRRSFGPRSAAACRYWGEWEREGPYVLPRGVLRTSRAAWRLVLRRQLKYMAWPPWRMPYRLTVGVLRLLAASGALGVRAALRSRSLLARDAVSGSAS